MRFCLTSRGSDGCYGDKCAIIMGVVPICAFFIAFWSIGLL